MRRFNATWLGLCLIFIGAQFGMSEENRIVGEPVGSNIINRNNFSSVEPTLVLKESDHLGASVKLCKDCSDSPCDEMDFLFPQLRFDRPKKLVFYGDTPVASFRPWGERIKTMKGYRLTYKIVPKPFDQDTGRTVDTLQVFLEPR